MKRLILSLPLVVAASSIASAASIGNAADLDGNWKYDYSCADATGGYAERCAAGERDDFDISIVKEGERVCGGYETTAQLGNRVDDGTLAGWKFSRVGKGVYMVNFHLQGTIGMAEIHAIGNTMAWKLLTKRSSGELGPYDWSFEPPSSAILTREPASQVRHPAKCDN